jgi:hypothetical protein
MFREALLEQRKHGTVGGLSVLEHADRCRLFRLRDFICWRIVPEQLHEGPFWPLHIASSTE